MVGVWSMEIATAPPAHDKARRGPSGRLDIACLPSAVRPRLRVVRRTAAGPVVDLGYVPDVNARKLRLGAGHDVGAMVTNLRNPFYSELATAIEARLRELDYCMILATDNGEASEQLFAIDRLMSLRVAEIILTPVSTAAVQRLMRNKVRVVQVDRIVGRIRTDAVVSVNEEGATQRRPQLSSGDRDEGQPAESA